MTSATDLVTLTGHASLTGNLPSDALIRLDASALTVTRGALFSLAGGSTLNVTGDLVRLLNGSSLTLMNGPLLSLSGDSNVGTISGALVAYGAGSNTLSITNRLCPCTLYGGIPVAVNGSPTISITNPIKNLNLGGTLNIQFSNPVLTQGGTALVVVNGTSNSLTVRGQ